MVLNAEETMNIQNVIQEGQSECQTTQVCIIILYGWWCSIYYGWYVDNDDEKTNTRVVPIVNNICITLSLESQD